MRKEAPGPAMRAGRFPGEGTAPSFESSGSGFPGGAEFDEAARDQRDLFLLPELLEGDATAGRHGTRRNAEGYRVNLAVRALNEVYNGRSEQHRHVAQASFESLVRCFWASLTTCGSWTPLRER